jgi:hypothetical protein
MPRNTTGGSSHRSQKNSEGAKERNNRVFVDELLDDYAKKEDTQGVYVGRVLKRMGCGRMEVFYMDASKKPVQQIMKMRGGLTGKGKRSVWVDVDSVVMIAETGLAGTTHEIVAVFSEKQISTFKKVMPDADPRLFLKSSVGNETTEQDDLFEDANEDEDVDIDAI